MWSREYGGAARDGVATPLLDVDVFEPRDVFGPDPIH